MHQEIECKKEEESLKETRLKLIAEYRGAVRWACNALEYKRKFEREEDFSGLADVIEALREDSRDELKRVAADIKSLRKRIVAIENKLLDLNRGKKK